MADVLPELLKAFNEEQERLRAQTKQEDPKPIALEINMRLNKYKFKLHDDEVAEIER